VRILVLGAGVIGSVYAGKLLAAGHEVVIFARGSRLVELQTEGLILKDAESGIRVVVPVAAVSELVAEDRFDSVLVPVRAEQLPSTLPILMSMRDGCNVLFFGNSAGHQTQLIAALSERALFGFPAVAGVRDGSVIRYVQIRQQKTMLGEASGVITPRVRQLQGLFSGAGFPTTVSANIDDWLLGHAAFVVPVAFALYWVGTDTARLAADHITLRRMVRATRQAFQALHAAGNAEIPTNLRILYLRLPIGFAVGYWRRVFAGPRGELWFGAHSRAAPEEMHAVAAQLKAALHHIGRPTPDLDLLLAGPSNLSPSIPDRRRRR
jgi:2-dehydropantoate 2-reductase